MTLPSTFDGAMAMLGQLVQDPLLVLGIQTVAVVLIGSGVIAALIVTAWVRR